ncbi:MAG: AAA family ATPase, partial [Ktedonobacteraceae bacterium]|nr:AAA family ATPase [Ktedonobacteraceae bacterium]
MTEEKQVNQPQTLDNKGITRITVGGFKSIVQEKSIEVRPLTILAGANSSGKSSIMQPLLLLKQTLDATYDPGPLLLNGPNVRFTLVDQLFSKIGIEQSTKSFHIGIEISDGNFVTTYFGGNINKRIDVEQTIYGFHKNTYRLYKDMSLQEIETILPTILNVKFPFQSKIRRSLSNSLSENTAKFSLDRLRCFLTLTTKSVLLQNTFFKEEPAVTQYIRKTIHLPGLRGNPERTYPVTAVGSEFPGTFEKYVASIIGQWQTDRDIQKLGKVNRDLARLSLTGGVSAERVDDTQVELLVYPYFRKDKFDPDDMVSIADVGIGISQVLPVIVALHTANPDQLIYIEQPELHLHPRAQSAMAEVLADAAQQGTRMVIETHSSLLLLGIQTLVAEGKLPPELVKLHWFQLLEDGSTQITSADLDETGAFGDWPEDFAEV